LGILGLLLELSSGAKKRSGGAQHHTGKRKPVNHDISRAGPRESQQRGGAPRPRSRPGHRGGDPPATIHDDDEVQPVPEEALTPLREGEDPVRLYLKESARFPSNGPAEVQIGRRIEVGQIALRRGLAGIRWRSALLDVGDGSVTTTSRRRRDRAARGGRAGGQGDPSRPPGVRPHSPLERKIARLEDRLATSAARSWRANVQKQIATYRAGIQKTVADMPLKPALIDDLVGKVRRLCQRIDALAQESRRNRTTAPAKELKRSSRRPGYCASSFRPAGRDRDE